MGGGGTRGSGGPPRSGGPSQDDGGPPPGRLGTRLARVFDADTPTDRRGNRRLNEAVQTHEAFMSLHVQSLPPRELEFQMFVMDELADAAEARGEDVIKLTIGVTDLPAPKRVRRKIAEKVEDLKTTRRVFPEGLPELREAISR